jgi:hypothetical protein
MSTACQVARLIKSNHLNASRLQKGGRPSKSGSVFGAERSERANQSTPLAVPVNGRAAM